MSAYPTQFVLLQAREHLDAARAIIAQWLGDETDCDKVAGDLLPGARRDMDSAARALTDALNVLQSVERNRT